MGSCYLVISQLDSFIQVIYLWEGLKTTLHLAEFHLLIPPLLSLSTSASLSGWTICLPTSDWLAQWSDLLTQTHDPSSLDWWEWRCLSFNDSTNEEVNIRKPLSGGDWHAHAPEEQPYLDPSLLGEVQLVIHSSSSVQFRRSVVSDSLRPYGLQHARPPCPSPTPGVYSDSCPLSRWCHPAISSSVVPFSSCPQSSSNSC